MQQEHLLTDNVCSYAERQQKKIIINWRGFCKPLQTSVHQHSAGLLFGARFPIPANATAVALSQARRLNALAERARACLQKLVLLRQPLDAPYMIYLKCSYPSTRAFRPSIGTNGKANKLSNNFQLRRTETACWL